MRKNCRKMIAWLLVLCFSLSNGPVLGVAQSFAYSNLRAVSTGNSVTLDKMLSEAGTTDGGIAASKTDLKMAKVYSNVLGKLNSWKQGEVLKLTKTELNSVLWQIENFQSTDDYMQMKRIVHRLNNAQLDSLKKTAEKKGFGRAFEKVATKTKVVVTAANALIFWAGAFNALMENYEPSMEIVAFKMLKGKKDYTVQQLVELNTHLNGPFTPYKVEGLVPAKGKISNGLEGDAKKEVEALFVPGSKDLGRPAMTIPVFSGEYNGDQMMDFLEAKGLAVDVIAKYGPAKETDTIAQYLPYLKRGIPIAAASPINGDLKKLMVEAGYSADSVKEALYSTGRDAIDESVLVVDTLTCTSNAMLSIIKAIFDAYGIDTGSGITVHAATDSNEFFFGPSGRARSPEDLLRGMSIYNNIQTAGTGAAANLFKIAPDLLGNFIIKAVRTSNVTGSFWFLTINLKNPPADVAEFKAKLKEFAQKQSDGVVKYYEGDEGDSWAPLESNRIVGWNNISIIDGFNIEMTANKKTVTVGGFYDNQEAAPWQITGKWAPWMRYVREAKEVRNLVAESKGTVTDGGVATTKIAKIFSENVVKGSAKADDVGRVVSIAKLVEEGLDGALLGHSATRRAVINELQAQIEKALTGASMDSLTAKIIARKQAVKRFDELMNKRMQGLLAAGVKNIPLCVGSEIKEVTLKEQINDITNQLEVSFNGIEKSQLSTIKLYVAFEPTNLIGKIAEAGAGADVAAEVGMIRDVHQAIFNWFEAKYGTDFAKSVNILYGASVSGDNVDRIMAVTSEQANMKGYPLVHGALFASSGKKVDGFLAVAEGIDRAGKRDGRQYTSFVNLKAFARADKTSAIDYIAKIKEAVEKEKISLANVELAIADQDIHLKEWQSARDAVATGVSLTDGGSLALDVLTIDNIANWKGLTAALRIDTNAGLVDGKIQKSKKSEKAAQTIKELSDKGARLVILDHQAKKGEADFLENLESMAALLSELSGKNIKYVDALTGDEVTKAIASMKDGDVIMLKNVRIDDSETAESTPDEHSRDEMVRTIEPLIDVFVNDAFSTAHRNQRSIVGFTGVPNVAGRLMETEIRGIAPVISLNAKPFVMSLGGGKAEDYLSMMKQVLKEGRVDTIVTGGLLGQLCLVAKGYKLGAPTEDFMKAKFDKAYKKKGGYDAMIKELQFMLENYGDKIIVPMDLAYVDAQGNRKEMKITEENKEVALNSEFSFGDIGQATANKYANVISAAKATYVKGPMGAYENENLRLGTKIVFTAAVANSKKTVDEKSEKAISLGGGGDTGQVLKLLGLSGFTFESTSGGGVIEAIKVGLHNLPGIKAMLRSGKTVMSLARNRDDIAQNEAVNGVIADKRVYNAQAGEEYKTFINSQLGLLEDESLQKTQKAVVFSQDFFNIASSKAAVAELAVLSKIVKVCIFGKSAHELKLLLGNDDIIIGNNLKDVLAQLDNNRVNANNIVVIRTPQQMVDFSTAFKVKQLVVSDAPALFIAKALKELFNKRNTNEAFARMFELMSKKSVVTKETYDTVKTSMLAKLADIGDFSSSVKISETTASKVEESKNIAVAFMNKV